MCFLFHCILPDYADQTGDAATGAASIIVNDAGTKNQLIFLKAPKNGNGALLGFLNKASFHALLYTHLSTLRSTLVHPHTVYLAVI